MKKFLIGIFSTLVSIVLLVGISSAILLNLTPNQLGFGNYVIAGSSLTDLGIADTKIIDILTSYGSTTSIKEEQIVTNPYVSIEEKGNVSNNLANSDLSGQENYSSLVNQQLNYDKYYLIDYADSTLAYIFDNIVQSSGSTNSAFKVLNEANVTIKEISITTANNINTLKVVANANISHFKNDIITQLGVASKFIAIPDNIYLVSESSFNVDQTGKIQTTPVNIYINEKDNICSEAIFKVVLTKIGGVTTKEDLNHKFGEAFSTAMFNLGKVGNGEKINTTTNEVNEQSITYGNVGIKDHHLMMITHKR